MEIKIGSIIPDIKLKDQNGHLFDLKAETAGKNVVLFFYPKASTPGCTAEACDLRDHFTEIKDASSQKPILVLTRKPESGTRSQRLSIPAGSADELIEYLEYQYKHQF